MSPLLQYISLLLLPLLLVLAVALIMAVVVVHEINKESKA